MIECTTNEGIFQAYAEVTAAIYVYNLKSDL